MYIAFLDEFGHIGPFVSRKDRRFNQSPVFGLAGYFLPHQNVRSFATWFYQFKNNLLAAELKRSGQHPATWEKKGAELFTSKNVGKYRSLTSAGARIVNQIYKRDGRLFYYGRHKYQTPQQSKASGLYSTVLGHSVRNIDHFCGQQDQQFMMILDQHADRIRLLETAAKTMFGSDPARNLVEPPFQVESHLYQTIQAADWLAAWMGRLMAFRVLPDQFPEWDWAERHIGTKVDAYSTHSTLWRPRPPAQGSAVATPKAASILRTIKT
jgi:Protein of unknown function (DUF3800)